MLQISDLSIARGKGEQAHHVYLPELELQAGQIIAVTVESGCGKSTLLEAIGLLLKPSHVANFTLSDDQQHTIDIATLIKNNQASQLADIRSRQLGFVLQNGGLLPYLSVRDNIRLPSQLLGVKPDKQMFERIINTLKLAPLLSKYPTQLSFGERQRTAFARAIIHHPWLILADEPTAALDPYNAEKLFSLFIDLVSQEGMMALVVCHDWPLVKRFNLPCLQAEPNPISQSANTTSTSTKQRGTYFVL